MSSSFFLKKPPSANQKQQINTKRVNAFTNTKGRNPNAKQKKTHLPFAGKRKKGNLIAEKPVKKRFEDDEEIASDEDDDEDFLNDNKAQGNSLEFSEEEEIEETPQDKRLRLAKIHLDRIRKEEAEKAEDDEIHDHVSKRLRGEYLDSVGKLRKQIATHLNGYNKDNIVRLKHKKQHLPMCCFAISSDGEYLFSGSKTPYVLKWDLKSSKSIGYFDIQPFSEDKNPNIKRRCQVVAICLTNDMRYLALADGGNGIQIWCPKEMKHLKTFHGHRDIVTCLTFRKDSHDLYSGSKDRSVKLWSLDEMGYIESLFGHQTAITGIDALLRERPITSGGMDSTIRIWKITEESQLIYNGNGNSIENVKFLNDETFISSGVDGSLSLWTVIKKKPIHTVAQAHQIHANGEANWITAIACVVNSDLVASGSYDGFIRLWQTSDNCRRLECILEIPIEGFINHLEFNSDGTKLFAAVGQEHRLGRWWRLPQVINHIVIIELLTT